MRCLKLHERPESHQLGKIGRTVTAAKSKLDLPAWRWDSESLGSDQAITRFLASAAAFNGDELSLANIELSIFDDFPLMVVVLAQNAFFRREFPAKGYNVAHVVQWLSIDTRTVHTIPSECCLTF